MNRETTNLKKEEITRKWYIVDAKDKPLGRLASEIVIVLMGKNKPSYTPNQDCGDYVIVINASKVAVSGNNKLTNKKYYNVSGYNGGLRVRTLQEMLEKYPVELMERVVWGMIPKGKLGRQIYKKLFVYAEESHKQQAQNPTPLTFKSLGDK